MANVVVQGIFMGANVRTSSYDGKERSSLIIDIYQPECDQAEKTVQVRSENVSLINDVNKDYIMGSPIEVTASVNAYKNKAYFKLLKIG